MAARQKKHFDKTSQKLREHEREALKKAEEALRKMKGEMSEINQNEERSGSDRLIDTTDASKSNIS